MLCDLAQSRWFLECTEYNFLTQATDASTGEDALDFLFTNKEEFIWDMKVKSSPRLTCSNHETVELKILQEISRTNILTVLSLMAADSILFRTYLVASQRELPWKAKGPRRAGCSLRTASSRREDCSFCCGECRGSMEESQHG